MEALTKPLIKLLGRLARPLMGNHHYMRQYGHLFVMGAVVGVVGGLGAILFRLMISLNRHLFFDSILPFISLHVGGYNISILLLPMLGGLVVGPLIVRFAREAKGHGVPEIIEAVQMRGGIIRPRVALVKIIVSSITIGSGGSAGREGPIAQIGAVFGSVMGRIFYKNNKKYIKLAVACGVAAGISATFNAPLGGAVFAMEVIMRHAGLTTAIPVLIAAAVGDVIMTSHAGFAPAFQAPPYSFQTTSEIPIFFVMGGIFGLLAAVWSGIFYRVEDFFESLPLPEKYRPAVGGALVGLIGIFLVDWGIMGVGYEGIEKAIRGDITLQLLILLGLAKIFATSFTIGSGASGGIFAPSLYIGSMFGAAAGIIVHSLFPGAVSQPEAYTLIGMGALFAGACRAPVTTLIMIPEMTGNNQLLLPMTIVCSTSYFVTANFTATSMYLMKIMRKGVNIGDRENPLEEISVREVMSTNLVTIDPDVPAARFMDAVLRGKHPGFPVKKNGEFLGYLSLYTLRDLEEKERKNALVRDIMNKNYPTIKPDESVFHALNLMNKYNWGRIMVTEEKDGKKNLIGVISKSDVIKAYEKLME